MIKEPVKRADVPKEDTWDLSLMYKTVEDWEAELASVSKLPSELSSLKEKAVSTPEALLEAIIFILQAYRRAEKVFTYAHMLQDQDLSDPMGNEMNQKAMDLLNKLATSISWFNPEVLSVPEETMVKWISETPLATYRIWLEDILRNIVKFTESASESPCGIRC